MKMIKTRMISVISACMILVSLINPRSAEAARISVSNDTSNTTLFFSNLTEVFWDQWMTYMSGISTLESNAYLEQYYEFVKNSNNDLNIEITNEKLLDWFETFSSIRSKNSIINGYVQSDFTSDDWNMKMLSKTGKLLRSTGNCENKIKVAIIDSGINYSIDIDVAERKDFISDSSEEEISVLYEDFSGHGTNIAGVISAKNNDEGITGGNPNVILYSAKVLDENNEAPISRVVSAIDWAIEKEVNIINLSFTTDANSEELYAAIKRAYDHNILLVAAAGNSGYVAYPAAYAEVMAVGSVNSQGQLSEFSPIDDMVEILAPGELITSSDVFGTTSTHSGTSYAAPHITAIASRLWERDASVSANYIRAVLDISANLQHFGDGYGFGIVDYDFACLVFDALKPFAQYCDRFDILINFAINMCNIHNPNRVPIGELSNDIVEGAWSFDNNGEYTHMALLDGLNVKNANGRAIIMAGCIFADRDSSGLKNMYLNPYFHGYAFYNDSDTSNHANYITANYLAGVLYLSKMARSMVRGNIYTTNSVYVNINRNGSTIYALNNIIDNTYLRKSSVAWQSIQQAVNNINSTKSGGRTSGINFDATNTIHRGLFMYGLTLHSIADIFAHSTAEQITVGGNTVWKMIPHSDYNNPNATGGAADNEDNDTTGTPKRADNVNVIPARNAAAELVCKRALRMFSLMNSSSTSSTAGYSTYDALDMSIFDLSGYNYHTSFRLVNFDLYAKQVCKSSAMFRPANESYYDNSTIWQVMDAGTFKSPVISDGMPYFNPITKQFQSTPY